MSRMVESPARSAPLRVVLILSICMAGLLVHFCAGNLAPLAQAFGMEWIDPGQTHDQGPDSGEDLFILPEYIDLKILLDSIRTVCPVLLVFASISFRPLLPPPIAS